MRLHKARRDFGYDINIAPLIDVVFLLIVFFLTVSHIAQVRVEALSLPEAQQGDKADEVSDARVIINVTEEAHIVISGQKHSTEYISQLLDREIQQLGQGAVSVLIRADRKVAWKIISEILQVCSQKGIMNVSVGVIEPGRSDIITSEE